MEDVTDRSPSPDPPIHLPPPPIQDASVPTRTSVIDGMMKLLKSLLLSRSTAMLETDLDMVFGIIRGLFGIVGDEIELLDGEGTTKLFKNIDSLISQGFKNQYKRQKVLDSIPQYIRPTQKQMGTMSIPKKDGTGMRDAPVMFTTFPLRSIIEVLIRMTEVAKVLTDLTPPSPNVLLSSRDGGAIGKARSCLQAGEALLPLSIYYDDANPGNGLNYKSSAYTIGYFHITIGGLPGHMASNRRYKHPFVIGYARDLKAYNWKPIYDYIVTEMKSVGTFSVKGSNLIFKPFLLNLIGDNKGVHEVLGLSTCFNFGSVCRWCNIHYNEIHECLRFECFEPRTIEDYERVWEDGDETLLDNYGMKYKCGLNALDGFNSIENCPPDICHDVLEGVSRKEISLVQQMLQGSISLHDLNVRISRFNYGHHDSPNRPSDLPSPSSSTIGNKAVQTWVLIRYIPLIVSDLVNAADARWNHFLLFHSMVERIFQPSFTTSEIDALESAIEDWIDSFITVYGGSESTTVDGKWKSPLTPKHHFIIHYPSQIRQFGPLAPLSTLTWEQLHLIGKQRGYSTRNYINLPYTLSHTYALRFSERYAREYSESNPKNPYPLIPHQVDHSIQPILALLPIAIVPIDTCKTLEFKGNQYTLGDIVITGVDIVSSVPNFLRIDIFLHFNNNWHVGGNQFTSPGRDQLTRAYPIVASNAHLILPVSSLHSPFPLSSIHSNLSQTTVVLKHNVS